MDATVISIVVALLLVVVVAAIRWLRNRSKSRANVILLAGVCGSGKTSLMSKLRTSAVKPTLTSLSESTFDGPLFFSAANSNEQTKKRSVHVVDVPGHDRVRLQAVEKHANKCSAIVYLVDSVTFPSEARDVAECMYDFLCNESLRRRRVPFLVVCNKIDLLTALPAQRIRAELERELDRVRNTRAAAPSEQVDGDDAVRSSSASSASSSLHFLGDRNKPFAFSGVHIDNPVQFVAVSVKSASQEQMVPLYDFILKNSKD
jgi:signal recognition particle receptor subunit beta